MITLISIIVTAFILYIIIADRDIIHESISYSYYVNRSTGAIFGVMAGTVGALIATYFDSPLTLIGGVCLIGVPVAGNFQNRITGYVHYGLAATFFVTLLLYSKWSVIFAVPFVATMLILKKKKSIKLSIFWLEVIGIALILIGMGIKHA
jgi:hypothetical protein